MAEFTLQLLHATDQEGAAPALVDAPNLSAVLNALEDDFENTLILSSGDLWLPGLFYSASAEVYGFTNAEGEFEGVPGIADILINSALGFEAVAFGNHEFDQGTGAIAALLQANPDITGPGIGEDGYQGAAFPYLSANLDFAADPNLSDLVVEDGQNVDDIEGNIAKSAIATVGGEKIGLVGATTPTLPTVSSPGDDVDVNPDDPDDFDALAAIIQAEVDELLANNPDLNKVILLSHMQVLDIEVNELAPRLSGVDIIIGGGSDTILADEFDRLRDGDEAGGPYPIIQTGADGNPVAIVNTDGQYLYVGQLVVDFNEDGVIILDSIDPMVSGAFATDEEGVAALGAEGLTDPVVTEVIAALNEVIEEKERNVFGVTEVFLNGRRSGGGLDGVRNQETNLGNLTAEANLWYARLFDEAVDISIKNGGGIRESIGAVVTPPGGTEPVRVPPEANPNFDKPEGGITQTDVESVLAFNNGLTVVTATVEELKAILEHAVSGATAENINTDFGSFAQVAGIQFSFDIAFEPGNRVRSLTLTDDDGNDTEVLVQNGEIQGDPTRTYRLVTLNFLANGGSGYPIPQTDRIDLVEQGDEDQDLADFAETGSEQDAFAEYLAAFFPADEDPATPVFMMEDTVVSEDERIQNLFFREDTVIDGAMPPVEEPTDPEAPDFSNGFEGPFSEIGRLVLAEGAEINAFDPASATLFVVSGGSILQAVDLSDPASPMLSELIDLGVFGGGVNSVAVKDGIVALAVEANTSTDEGTVVFLTTDGQFLESVGVGAVPDMVTFTPDGTKVLVANEGEPNDDYSVDPAGSVSIIDISGGVENATATIADFTAFNDQKAELQAEGVKLFGLDATVAEDLEPEYIAISPDGSTAWVTLQENNAVAVVDIENATVQAILPLGAKDFSKGQPELTSYEVSDRGPITNGGEPLTTATGETIELGGFSGLFYDGMAENGNLKFLAVPDRGPNGDADGGDRPFLLPDYQARVVFLELNEATGEVSITDQLFLTQADGTPITGLPNIPNEDRRAVDALGNPVDLEAITELDASEFGADYDPLGADMEGIVRAGDGTYWMVDEYRPAIYHFDTDGTLINRFVPEGTTELANELNPDADFELGTFGTETLPAEYVNRRANRGFEGMALDTDEGILYAFIQTPLSNPDRETGDNSTVIRLLGINPTSGEPVAEYVYLLQKPDIGGNVDKIGDAVYAGDGKFFVMERDSSLEPTAQKFIFEMDLKGATNVLGADFGGETLEQQTADSLAALGINPVNKIKVTNLPSLGYLPSDKPEGLAYLPDGRLVVLNDNDFGLEPGAEAVELGIIDFSNGNQLDASNEDDGINIRNWPVFGLYQPDAIASYEVDGITYYVTANEGDARLRPDGDLEDEDGNVILEEGAVFNEENRVGDEEIVLDPEAFPNAAELKRDENLGRLNITNTLGDTDGDGDFDQLFSYGGRSFSIWDENGNLVFDSSDDIANITAQLTPELFNANDGIPEEFDERSDDKGAEPEAVTVGQIGDTIYAFVSLERAGGGVLIYDVTNPAEAEFVQYVRNDEDIAPEGLTFISDFNSPNGNNLLVVTNEESNTLTVYSDGEGDGGNGGTGTTSIFDIQGAGHISPLLGDTVTTTGIVTAVDTNGFYIQDAEGDGDIATSDALFVFTGGEPGVAVGDALNVTGTVSEFTPGGPDTGNLSATQISGDPEIEILSSGNDLPAAVIIGEGGRIPPNVSIDDDAFASFDPETDGIDFFESLEAMRVTAQDAVAVSGTNRFGEIFTVVDGGESATGLSDRGTLNISPDDFNPEKVQIDEDSGIFDFDFPSVDVGAFLGDVTGVVGYGFGNFEIYPTEDFGVPTWDIEYSGWWDAEGGGTLSGTLFAEAAAAADGILTPDELLAWEWNWSGNDAVAAFSIASTDVPGAEIQPFGLGFYVDGTPNLPGFADDLDQGVFVGGESGEFILDLEFLTIEDNTETFPAAEGDFTAGNLFAMPGDIAFTDAAWELEYSGWWDVEGGGTLSGTLFTEGTAAADGIITPEELLAWEWDWSGNDEVAAFSINSGDSGAELQQFGPTGFYVDGTANLPNLADDLEQGVFVGGESGEFVLDLEFLTIEDNSVSFPTTTDGDVTVGDVTPTGDIAFTEVVWGIEYSGWWDAEGGGTLAGTLVTDAAAAADGILSPEELLDWQWDWSGNDEVSPFFISSSDSSAEIQQFGSSGFYIDGTPNLPGVTDDLDQGVFIGGESGEFVLDLEFLTIEDNTEAFPSGEGDVTVGEAMPAAGEITVTDSGLAVVPSSIQPEISSIVGGEDKLTVASYNLLNLDPTIEAIERVDDNDEGDIDDDIGNGRFEAIAQQIVTSLNAPDILGLQEIQDNDGAEITDVSEADETLQTLIEAIAAAGGPTYEFIDTPNVLPTFIDEDGSVVRPSGGQPGGNIRNAFLYNPDRVNLVEGSVQPIGSQAVGATFEGARRPLSATFEFNGEEITIVNNHFSSKGGSAPILGVEQPFEQRQEDPDVNGSLNERRVQAQAVNNFVDEIFAADADANVVVLGDLNEFEFISPLDILAGTVESTDDGFGIEPTGEAAILNNLVNTVDPDERYSFIFQGNSQVLDHILVSDSLFDGAEFDFVNTNVEFAETDSRASDHEPILASFDFGDDMAMPVEELLDLTGFDGQVAANVTLSREAGFDNILQFYETDAEGSVGGLLPGETGYEDAVRENLISGLELFVDNLATTNTDVLISGGTFYAPALLVDGDPQNLVTIDDAAMGMSMIQREGNVWRFEDLTDFDFNDFVLTLNSAEAITTA